VFGGTLAGSRGTVTITLIAINVVVAILALVYAGGRGLVGGGFGGLMGGITPLLEQGAVLGQTGYQNTQTGAQFFGPAGIASGEYYRLFTAMFLHYGALHLLMNMWALWVLGRTLEAALGSVRFLVLYLVAGLAGNVAAYVFAPSALSAGASTAIFGLFAALFIVMKRLRRDTSSIVPILVINIAISFLPGVSLAGHFGGLVAGAVVAFALAYAPAKTRNLMVTGTVLGLLGVMVVAVVLKTASLQAFVPI
jgi:membrane associated rhomboid family serine protease